MQVEIKKIDHLKRELKIEIKGDEFLKDKNDVYLEIGKNLKVSGFRLGYAPLEVLEKHHSNFLKEEFLKRMLPKYCQEAFRENKLEIASQPKIYDLIFTKDSLSFSAEVEIKPKVEIEDKHYKGILIKNTEIEVKEEEIQKALTNIQEDIKKYMIDKDLNDVMIAKWFSYPDVNSLKEFIRVQLFIQKAENRRKKINNQIIAHLLKEIKFQVPKAEVEQHHQELIRQNIYELKLRGVSDEDIEKYKKDLQEKLLPVAEEQVKLYYILDAIRQRENIKVDNELFDVILAFILSKADYKD